MKVGVAPHRLWPDQDGDLRDVVGTARVAESLGFDHIIAGSHVLATDLGLTLDPMVLLSAIAGATSRIGVVTSVLILPLYNPVIIAHQAASLDHISGGRFILGVGTGWDADEFAAIGVPFKERGRRTDEHLTVIKELWHPDPSRLGVTPRTPGGPPIWVGGQSDAALHRALRFGDAWHGSGADPAAVARIRRRLAELAEDRDPATLELTLGAFLIPPGFRQAGRVPDRLLGGVQPSADSIVDDLGLLGEAGVTTLSLWLPVDTAALPDALAWASEYVLQPLMPVPGRK
jgi:probable F420-dependent oxidoreductase